MDRFLGRGAARSPNDRIEARLLGLAALFVILYAAILTLSPAARTRSWQVDYRWNHWFGFAIWLVLIYLAHHTAARRLPGRDPYLLPIAALLSGWGLMTIWRLNAYLGLRQSIWLLAGGGILITGISLPLDLSILRRYKYMWLTGGLLLTALTLLLGTNPLGYGPRMWLGCCGIYLQPSEPLKLLLIVYLAAYLAGLHLLDHPGPRQAANPTPLLPLLAPTLLLTGIALLLLVVQRDLGTASVFLFLYACVTYIATRQWRILAYGALALLVAGIGGYALFDLVRIRVDAWLNPWADPSGRSYQIVQSLLAVANGGLVGRGPGLGNPSLVPIPHSDFIFAAISEEAGFIGSMGLILLVGLLANRGLRAAIQAPDLFRRFLAAGLTAHLTAQTVLIIGGNLRLLPLTGVTLPFVSYGGSSLVTSFISLLILLLISNRTEEAPPADLPEPQPYLYLSTFLSAGLLALGLAAGWWSFVRAPDLLTRTDNARRAIADRFVRRGSILDRNSDPLAQTIGVPGEYTQQITYPPLSPVVGYNSPVYGLAGLEDSLDPYLRGLQGNPGLVVWWNHLLYGQPPPGLDVRTSLDLSLQQAADEALGDYSGALVLLNADSGEILAMASHPNFDANSLDESWNSLIQDPQAPLLNRATQGRYPAGELASLLFPQGLASIGLEQQPQLRLAVGDASTGRGSETQISPLQAALAAAALSSGGTRPAAHLARAVDTPAAGWVLLDVLDHPVQVYSTEQAAQIAVPLVPEGQHIWQFLGSAPNGPEKTVAWFVGGTRPNWDGVQMAAAVLLESDDLAAAQAIGSQILNAAILP